MNATSSDSDGLYIAPISPNQPDAHQKIDFHPQGDGDLGERLDRAFSQGFDEGYKSIAVIGTDCPSCGARWINAAFSRLESNPDRDAVIGPTPDGGYYLLGLDAPAAFLFQDIPWSSHKVLNSTIRAADNNNLTLTQLPTLSDIDHLEDWNKLLATPLGAAIKKALGEEIGDHDSDLHPL